MPEPEPEPVEEKKPAPAPAWDGWKELLEKKEKDVEKDNQPKLPPANFDPNYVPTPPKPSFAEFTARGKSTINFSEDVITYDDLKNKKIMIP